MASSRLVRKAVILAGGWGTRFLPFSKAVPKEMLPIEGIPAIQYVVEECLASGLEDITIITRPGDQITRDYFVEENTLLNKHLDHKDPGPHHKLAQTRLATKYLRFVAEEPSTLYGSGIPVLQCREYLRDEEAFAILFADDVIFGAPATRELIAAFDRTKADSVIAMQRIVFDGIAQFGRLELGDCIESVPPRQYRVADLKQHSTQAQLGPGYAVVSRLILTSKIFEYLTIQEAGAECDLGVAIAQQAQDYMVVGCEISGHWVTVGDPEHYLLAQQQAFKLRSSNLQI